MYHTIIFDEVVTDNFECWCKYLFLSVFSQMLVYFLGDTYLSKHRRTWCQKTSQSFGSD